MDQCGIQYAIVNLTSPGIEGVSDASAAIRFPRATNDDIYHKYVERRPFRFGFFACVPMHDPVEAANLEGDREGYHTARCKGGLDQWIYKSR